MPAWKPEADPPPSQSLTPAEPSEKPKPPPLAKPAPPTLTPEVLPPSPPARQGKPSSIREGRELLAAKGLPAAEAILNMAGLGDPERAASDEAVRGQMLRYAADAMGLPAPQVSLNVSVAMSPEEAHAALSRLLGEES